MGSNSSFYVIEHKLDGRKPWYMATKDGKWVWASNRLDAIRFYRERDARQILDLDHTVTSKKTCKIRLVSPLLPQAGGFLNDQAHQKRLESKP